MGNNKYRTWRNWSSSYTAGGKVKWRSHCGKYFALPQKKTQNYHCCSVDESCPTFCDPQELQHARLPRPSLSSWDCSNLRSLIELVMPSNHLILCRSLLLPSQSFPAPGSFLMSQFSHQVAKVTPLLHIYPQKLETGTQILVHGCLQQYNPQMCKQRRHLPNTKWTNKM